jgi:hypothetical protein
MPAKRRIKTSERARPTTTAALTLSSSSALLTTVLGGSWTVKGAKTLSRHA